MPATPVAQLNSPGTGSLVQTREKLRPARPLQRCYREKTRPARHKTPILSHFSCAGRTFSRSCPHRAEQGELFALASAPGRAGRTFSHTGCCNVATLKPMTPLRPLLPTNVKPPSPMLAPKQQPLKPPSPLQPKTTPKTPVSHPQRRCRFQPHARTSEQRRHRFQLPPSPARKGDAGFTPTTRCTEYADNALDSAALH